MPVRFLDPAAAVEELIPAGAVVGVGGMHMTAAPMAVVNEVVRRRRRIGRLVTSPSASLQADLPIACGLVDEILSPYVGFEHLGLAPAYRRAVQAGDLQVREYDEGSLTHSLYAGAGGLAFLPAPPGVEMTDIPAVNPDMYRPVTDPFTGEECLAIPALRPDVVVIACRTADEVGNIAFGRFPFTDRIMALAARTLIVQVERVVPHGGLAGLPPGETLPSFLVSAVIEAPGGCTPTGFPGEYDTDEAAIVAYMKAVADPEAFPAWLAEHGLTESVEAPK